MSDFHKLARYSNRHQQKFQKICQPLFDTFKINYFFHQSVTDSGDYIGLGTQPDFVHFYFEERLHECNPFITQSENVKSGIYLFDTVQNNDFKDSMRVIEEKYNLKQSIVIVEREGSRCHQYGFAVPSKQCDIKMLVLNELPLFKQFIKFFNEEADSILKEMQHDSVSLPKNLKTSYKRKYVFESNIIPEVQLDRLEKLMFLSKMKMPRSILRQPKLSKREKECLNLYLSGFTAKEIGEELQISYRTVEFYMGNIRNKLSCHKKSDLFALLYSVRELGL